MGVLLQLHYVTFMFLLIIPACFIFTKSKISALLVLLLFFFNGGFGFIHFFDDLQTNSKSFPEFITHLEKDYTALKDIGYQWLNVMLSMIIPQIPVPEPFLAETISMSLRPDL